MVTTTVTTASSSTAIAKTESTSSISSSGNELFFSIETQLNTIEMYTRKGQMSMRDGLLLIETIFSVPQLRNGFI